MKTFCNIVLLALITSLAACGDDRTDDGTTRTDDRGTRTTTDTRNAPRDTVYIDDRDRRDGVDIVITD